MSKKALRDYSLKSYMSSTQEKMASILQEKDKIKQMDRNDPERLKLRKKLQAKKDRLQAKMKASHKSKTV